MTLLLTGPIEPVALPEQEAARARASGETISRLIGEGDAPLSLRVMNTATGEQSETLVPAQLVRLLSQALSQMAAGNPVTLVPLQAELSTQQAAEMLGVSRPYVVKMLEEGKIPYRKVGEQRRVRYAHVLAYLERERQESNKALDELVALSEEMGLYEMDRPAPTEIKAKGRKKSGSLAVR